MGTGNILLDLIDAFIAIVLDVIREEFSAIFDLIEIIQQLTM